MVMRCHLAGQSGSWPGLRYMARVVHTCLVPTVDINQVGSSCECVHLPACTQNVSSRGCGVGVGVLCAANSFPQHPLKLESPRDPAWNRVLWELCTLQ